MNFYQRIVNLSKLCISGRSSPRVNLFYLRFVSHKTQVCYSSKDSTSLIRSPNDTDTFLNSILTKIPFLKVNKNRLNVSGYLLYESVADKISYSDFFERYSLPDTFYSWFVVTELHVWMLMVRAMQEGDDGKFVRNAIVQALWADVQTRVKKLGAANPAEVRYQVDELSQQFPAAIVGYDEGLLSNDKVLASALWRRMFQKKCNTPEHLEHLIHYVRKEIKMLDNITTRDLFNTRQVEWTPIKSL